MGAVCYKPKKMTLSRDEVLKALTDKHLKETILDRDRSRSLSKPDDPGNNLITFTNMTLQLVNADTNESLN